MSIRQACADIVRQVRASNGYQLSRVSGLGKTVIQRIGKTGEIRSISTAMVLEETLEVLARDPSRGRLKRGRPSND